ncbi:uncharacterized protein BO95DRAFT_458618 [Aspergillus brunneoviolaceus CBS 621.78]|uniref:Uncharacterized protein n=1 Tax=Aspergillus brunneoviolaceus CBS 621.78 TaxID=1450534 RepID=A0ACD1GQ12_9EURO|nr:hypothetical protein BO95DRAFT_458618 [Aspergillus brunneoviolaceus CBS 621.78]RAH51265.1 hypothetical protein BO95DRAFT_458618 [Aspergillus brunneoviolaceus CBS 621.78]
MFTHTLELVTLSLRNLPQHLTTGVSGYLEGTLLARLSTLQLPGLNESFALVKTDAQDEACDAIRTAIIETQIAIAYFMIACDKFKNQEGFVQARSESPPLL